MTERLSDVQTRIRSVTQLDAVITAMRGIAAARSREVHQQLDGIRAYATTICTAIGRALAFAWRRRVPVRGPPVRGPPVRGQNESCRWPARRLDALAFL